MEWNTKVNRSGRMKRNIEAVFKQMEAPLTDYNRVHFDKRNGRTAKHVTSLDVPKAVIK